MNKSFGVNEKYLQVHEKPRHLTMPTEVVQYIKKAKKMSHRTLLGIETSTTACSVAIYRHAQVIERFEVIPKQHLQSVLSFVDQLLAETELHIAQFDAITFSHGPGSFTGLRIAASVVQGLAYATDLPVVPISTLATLAQGAFRIYERDKILVAMDARQNELYYGAYEIAHENIVESVISDQLTLPDQVELPVMQHEWIAIGDGWAAYEDELPGEVLTHVELLEDFIYPHAQDLFPLALKRCDEGNVVTAIDAVPRYLRDSVTS